ncbi:MAG: tRNA pseudouridine(38-40) synthase TruA [Clostridiales bacterium]|jgi:tRNA pseudouridine38-40 synthase|nr:tRNA pseudouridine(38-40) synthase TruA [Clostridiales bacterium]
MQALLTVAYDGTRYAGWQRQTNGLAVQQVIEDALAKLMGRAVVLRAASRTDAGVHALGQRAAFGADGLKVPLEKLPEVLNGLLPPDISVTAAEEAQDGFVPRFRAREKTYRYQIQNAPYPNPLIGRYSAWVRQSLDVDAMGEAAAHCIGRHDFKAFCAASRDVFEKSTVREVFSCGVEVREERAGSRLIAVTVTGGGFLYNMVRILAGTLVYAGLGKIPPPSVPEIIASKDRTRAGKTMPPNGLTLVEVVF